MDALSGGKHEFVKLLLDNGFDINRFLDYGRLSVLYLEVIQECKHFSFLLREFYSFFLDKHIYGLLRYEVP